MPMTEISHAFGKDRHPWRCDSCSCQAVCVILPASGSPHVNRARVHKMKVSHVSTSTCLVLLACVILTHSAYAPALGTSSDTDDSQPAVTASKRFMVDGVLDVLHALLDPVASLLTDTLLTLSSLFSRLVNGNANIDTVACKLNVDSNGHSRDEAISECIRVCLANATAILGAASNTSSQSCPVACA